MGYDAVLVDTAGRMQDNEPLMRALAKLVAASESPSPPSSAGHPFLSEWRMSRCMSTRPTSSSLMHASPPSVAGSSTLCARVCAGAPPLPQSSTMPTSSIRCAAAGRERLSSQTSFTPSCLTRWRLVVQTPMLAAQLASARPRAWSATAMVTLTWTRA